MSGGLSVEVPAGWHLARRLTALAEPTERFTLASYPLPRGPAYEDSCGPRTAVERIPRDGALAFVFEYPGLRGKHGFPPRPRRFRLPSGPPSHFDCFPTGWLLRFREHGRAFQIMVALGPRARANRARLLRALDGLRVDGAPGEA